MMRVDFPPRSLIVGIILTARGIQKHGHCCSLFVPFHCACEFIARGSFALVASSRGVRALSGELFLSVSFV